MATVILVRHGRTTANATAVLAGRAEGVVLDDVGREQVARAGDRLATLRLARLVTSPLERTCETADAIAAGQAADIQPLVDEGVVEVDYGEWQGRSLKELAGDELWKVVQRQPSAVTFPGGESLVAAAARAVSAVRRHDAEVSSQHGDDAVWALVSHGDILKAVLADALGSHLDQFQRIVVDPGSISVVRYTADRPYVLAVNTHQGPVALPPVSADAVPGGGAGPSRSGTET
ncbi:MSMEG_4193 family putative phosphomutase [Nocardioides seonyuensis]|uniref:MSMEG_4193 family putative phosphomutase n=1 Tax=Nocardioides seonyuensis TaxID=2518371 RepID=A0A4P7IKW9_9ACTN|nr:MSMEG_4193 family putative phosphomutase [Nocardioides seonyuensis]QBX57097.1 MSMEG_4193 family putative phosphomutase [Nocardioides seonyuensis]